MDRRKLSRTVSHALRHAPWNYDLEPDAEGWVPVAALLQALRRRGWHTLSTGDLEEMVAGGDKRRFEMTDGKIRAIYGHSLPRKVSREPAVPPARLFHGTGPEVLESIRREGLRPMRRQYVHLSTDIATALQVGRRKSPTPVVLRINAALAYGDGVALYRGNEAVWLADQIPPQYIEEI